MTAFPVFLVVGGLCGAAGVTLSAAAAHAGGGNVATAASMLLMHAPAFLALGLPAAPKPTRIAGFVLLAGLLVFACDLLARHYWGHRLFPVAAPLGGSLMIFGWLGVAGSAFFVRR